MTVEEAMKVRVAGLAAVVALASTRIYLAKLPQKPLYPAVRVQLIDDPSSYHLRGPNGMQRARIQVDAFAPEASGADPYTQVASLADAIHGDGKGTAATGLSGWKGSVGGLTIGAVFCIDRRQQYDPDELRLLTMSRDFYVWWKA